MYSIAHDDPCISAAPSLVVLSDNDWLLNNEYLRATYEESSVIINIDASHADTTLNPAPYKKIIDSILG